MNMQNWSERADYLKKRYDYARHVGSAQAEVWRLNLLAHLEAEPDSDTTPLPEITEPSTVEKFGDWWINHAGGSRPTEDASVRVEVRYRNPDACIGFHEQGLASGRYFWKWDEGSDWCGDIIAYRVVKD
jgi:hypothetical protein